MSVLYDRCGLCRDMVYATVEVCSAVGTCFVFMVPIHNNMLIQQFWTAYYTVVNKNNNLLLLLIIFMAYGKHDFAPSQGVDNYFVMCMRPMQSQYYNRTVIKPPTTLKYNKYLLYYDDSHFVINMQVIFFDNTANIKVMYPRERNCYFLVRHALYTFK